MDRAGPDCSRLGSLREYTDYVELLRNETGFDYNQLSQCRREICAAVWGTGNPDISGIGVTAGYVMEMAIGFCLALLVYVLQESRRPDSLSRTLWSRARKCAASGLYVYFDCAIYFTVAIELAIIVMLVGKDFGIGTDGFGAIETQTSLAISVLCVLPLLYPLVLLDTDLTHTREKKTSFRLFLFCLMTLLFSYPFISQCIHNWAPSRVGEGKGEGGTTIVTSDDWLAVERTCFDAVKLLSDTEHWVMAAFELVGSILIYLFVAWRLVCLLPSATEKNRASVLGRVEEALAEVRDRVNARFQTSRAAHVVLLLSPAVLAVPLLWGIFRLRGVQAELAMVTGSAYLGNDWGFGQVVSIVIFAPVFVEIWYALLYDS